METLILKTGETELSELSRKAAEIMASGELTAFPTETVYGLGGNGLNPEASEKIYAAKGRPSDNPLILHIAKREQLNALVSEIPENAVRLMDAFWPGPLTIIFHKSDIVPYKTSGGLDTVAIRMPSHEVAHAILAECDFPVAAPSANLSGRPSTTKASHVIEDLFGRVACIVDDGEVPIGIESTIVDVTSEITMLLRPGYITLEMLEQVVDHVETDPAIRKESIIHHDAVVGAPKAPGMKYRHYAPKAPLTVVYGKAEEVIEAISRAADENTVIISSDEHKDAYRKGIVLTVGSLSDRKGIAHNLFDVLRKCDELKAEKIYSEDFTSEGLGDSIMNRLLKAAGGNYKSIDELCKEETE